MLPENHCTIISGRTRCRTLATTAQGCQTFGKPLSTSHVVRNEKLKVGDWMQATSAEFTKAGHGTAGVFVCGPPSLSKDAWKCSTQGSFQWHFHAETFRFLLGWITRHEASSISLKHCFEWLDPDSTECQSAPKLMLFVIVICKWFTPGFEGHKNSKYIDIFALINFNYHDFMSKLETWRADCALIHVSMPSSFFSCWQHIFRCAWPQKINKYEN